MLQQQYFNSKLTKNQIDGIMNNFNIKYTTVKNEIDAKLNNLLKLFLNDIQPFLDNLEEISKERKKLKDFENIQREYNIMSLKLKEKISNEHRLESSIESLQKEITLLKNENKIKSSSKKLIEFKTPSNSQNKQVKSIFGRQAHKRMKSEVISINLDNKISMNNKKNTRNNKLINRTSANNSKSKKYINQRNNGSSSIKFKESIVIDKKMALTTNSLTTSKSNTNQNITMDKTIEKIKQYNENRNNQKIKKLSQFKAYKPKFINKAKTVTNNFFGYKKNVNNLNKKKKKENKFDKNKTFGPGQTGKSNKIIETNQKEDSKNINNYSEDDENKRNKNKSKSNSNSSRSKSSNSSKSRSRSKSCSVSSGNDSFRSDIESIEDEIKELEEDENNIILLMKQIKEFSSNIE